MVSDSDRRNMEAARRAEYASVFRPLKDSELPKELIIPKGPTLSWKLNQREGPLLCYGYRIDHILSMDADQLWAHAEKMLGKPIKTYRSTMSDKERHAEARFYLSWHLKEKTNDAPVHLRWTLTNGKANAAVATLYSNRNLNSAGYTKEQMATVLQVIRHTYGIPDSEEPMWYFAAEVHGAW
ncbi:hypothetical protein C8Q76DRAFT_137529 [Earliella scabrosa]|nr:hypothetical protein C8Q76DRAFT_137529 [Earliella scabrosa]